MHGFFSQLPYKCHLEEVAFMGDVLKLCPQLDSRAVPLLPNTVSSLFVSSGKASMIDPGSVSRPPLSVFAPTRQSLLMVRFKAGSQVQINRSTASVSHAKYL